MHQVARDVRQFENETTGDFNMSRCRDEDA
jgi:hypothetical protein